MDPGLKVAWPRGRNKPMKEYDCFQIYRPSDLQEKMNNEWRGWRVIAITNEHGTTLGRVIHWKVWVEKELE